MRHKLPWTLVSHLSDHMWASLGAIAHGVDLVCTSCFTVQKVEADKFHVLCGCGSLCMLNFYRSSLSEEKKLKDKKLKAYSCACAVKLWQFVIVDFIYILFSTFTYMFHVIIIRAVKMLVVQL